MRSMNLDKAQVARRQLGTALALFIDDLDPISVHTLACAGGEIAEHLTRKAGAKPFTSHALATFPDLKIEDVRRLQNQFWNAFKHAVTRDGNERNDRELLERFSDLQNDHTLFVGWYDYMLAVGTMPVEAQAFQTWYFALYPDKLNPHLDRSKYESLFPQLRKKSRIEQKKALRHAIAQARNDSSVMNDPRTDSSPLIIDAAFLGIDQ
jgi:hypothetical protein